MIRKSDRSLDPHKLGLDLVIGHPQLRGPYPFAVHQEGPSDRHARTGSNPVQGERRTRLAADRARLGLLRLPHYWLSPNFLAIRAAISSRHATASSPSHRIFTRIPWAAANIITPIIDFPFTVCPSHSTLPSLL